MKARTPFYIHINDDKNPEEFTSERLKRVMEAVKEEIE